ncbi:CopG family transcriptional regulator [Bradyrhizobium sp. RT5a]|uniref:ribbon-helix-helix domain-containing protein n=1 Tax=Bradyrhizobium sp. RT5a TaxID=3156380 RepID=UPI00339AE38C
MTMGMHFKPDSARSYVGFHLPAGHLAALDRARIDMRLSRSQLMRQVVAAHLQRLQAPDE